MIAASDKLLLACARFGRTPGELRALAAVRDVRGIARELDRLLRPGEVALIAGPSGGGKSSILRALEDRCECVSMPIDAPEDPLQRRCSTSAAPALVDLFASDLDATLGYLSRAGLADATVLPLSLGELSDGQRFRARLALAFERAAAPTADPPGPGRSRPPTLLIDEFASTLDRAAARTLAHLVNRCASRAGLRIVCATAHDDLLDALDPAVLVHQPLLRPASIARSPWQRASARCASSLSEEFA